MTFDFLIVGAGFAGSVLAERLASQLGKTCLIVEKKVLDPLLDRRRVIGFHEEFVHLPVGSQDRPSFGECVAVHSLGAL